MKQLEAHGGLVSILSVKITVLYPGMSIERVSQMICKY